MPATTGLRWHRRIAAAGQMFNDGLLRAAKGGIAEDVVEDLLGEDR